MRLIKCIVLFLTCGNGLFVVGAPSARGGAGVLPRPVIEKLSGTPVKLAGKAESVSVSALEGREGPVAEGLKLVRRRVAALGHELTLAAPDSATVRLAHCGQQAMADAFQRHGVRFKLEPSRLRQAYRLIVAASPSSGPRVTVEAADDWGLFYGLVSLAQILEANDAGELFVPAGELLDFPEIAHRLVKTSAAYPDSFIERLTGCLPLIKISQVGLQYHGRNSKDPGPVFTANIETFCRRFRRAGTLESIVYFCPFRGEGPRGSDHLKGAYDLSSDADRKAYAAYLRWIMDQGAHGIEVDYNDWPGSREVPIADVLNLAFKTVRERRPDAYVLYCPPATGREAYRGPATHALRETLSRVPAEIWPLWTGTRTLIEEPLTVEVVERWTQDAGRRPFLWVNRVGVHVQSSFSRPVPGTPDGRVFAGDLLPRELNRLFEGVHFNTGLITPGLIHAGQPGPEDAVLSRLDVRELVYLATAADFLWNPREWEPAESYRRAVRFVEILRTMLPDGVTIPAASRDAPG